MPHATHRAGETLRVRTRNYESGTTRLEGGIFKTERCHVYGSAPQVDAFASFWCLGYAEGRPGSIFVRSGQEWIPIEGPTLIFLPRFSIVEWKVAPHEEIRWTMYSSTRQLPFHALRRALLPVDRLSISSREEVLEAIQKVQASGCSLAESRVPSAVALKLKNWMDRRFESDARIELAAAELGISRVVLSRAFRNAYGLTPTEYRHRLRIFEALNALNDGKTVTDSLHTAGYADPSQFNLQFKRYLGIPPAGYSWSRSGRTSRLA